MSNTRFSRPLIAAILAASAVCTAAVQTIQAATPALPDTPPKAGIMPDKFRMQVSHNQVRGTEVESIRGVETITDWRTLDNQRLTLRVNHAQQYLLTLTDPCAQLRGARMVGVSMTDQEIWAEFDHVAADGWECRIDTITRLSSPRKRS